jgi:hypothetical protein
MYKFKSVNHFGFTQPSCDHDCKLILHALVIDTEFLEGYVSIVEVKCSCCRLLLLMRRDWEALVIYLFIYLKFILRFC